MQGVLKLSELEYEYPNLFYCVYSGQGDVVATHAEFDRIPDNYIQCLTPDLNEDDEDLSSPALDGWGEPWGGHLRLVVESEVLKRFLCRECNQQFHWKRRELQGYMCGNSPALVAGGTGNAEHLVHNSVVEQINASNLVGFEFLPVPGESYSCIFGDPIRFIRPEVHPQTHKTCVECKRDIVCGTCGGHPNKCSHCGRLNITRELAPESDLIVNQTPSFGVIDLDRFTGSDIGMVSATLILSARAVQFLASIRAAPFIAEPVRSGGTNPLQDDQRRLIEKISRL